MNKENVDVNAKIGVDALAGAAINGHVHTVQQLISLKANNLVDALIWATFKGKLEVVKLLLENGADPRVEGFDGLTALHIAEDNKRGKAFTDLFREWQNRHTGS